MSRSMRVAYAANDRHSFHLGRLRIYSALCPLGLVTSLMLSANAQARWAAGELGPD
jgi:hypothetical protein